MWPPPPSPAPAVKEGHLWWRSAGPTADLWPLPHPLDPATQKMFKLSDTIFFLRRHLDVGFFWISHINGGNQTSQRPCQKSLTSKRRRLTPQWALWNSTVCQLWIVWGEISAAEIKPCESARRKPSASPPRVGLTRRWRVTLTFSTPVFTIVHQLLRRRHGARKR